MVTIPEGAIRRAVAKAQSLQPTVLQVDKHFWAVASQGCSGLDYLCEEGTDGVLWCPCQGYSHTGYCYHVAAVGLSLGTIPSKFLAPVREGEPTPLRAPAGLHGRRSLYGGEGA